MITADESGICVDPQHADRPARAIGSTPPAEGAGSVQARQAVAELGERTKHAKIMIVDDEHSVRTSLREWFLEDGFDVVTAEDGLDALKKLDADPFDLMVLDLKMPGMDGISLQRRLKEVRPDLTIVILTAFGSVETAVEATRLGAYDFLEKPLSLAKLLLTVERALEADRLAQENVGLKRRSSQVEQRCLMRA